MTKTHSSDQHLVCFNQEDRLPLIRVIQRKKGEVYDISPLKNGILFVQEGKIKLSIGLINSKVMKANEMFAYISRLKGTIEVLEDCKYIIMRLDVDAALCECLPLNKLNIPDKKTNLDIGDFLPINSIIKEFLVTLERYFKDRICCVYFQELKVKEFLYLLRAYYSVEELQCFFLPILNNDFDFASKVSQNKDKVKTVKELAEALNYSLSGFEKRFKKVYGISARQWLEQSKAREIYHEITCSSKTITEIAYDFGFSPSHFNNYCKRVFKKSPTKIRQGSEE